MSDTLVFLDRLGLTEEADARAVRRAYARELKLIDQERDGAAFQSLREAYDTAVQWLAWRERQQDTQAPADTATPNYDVPRTPVTLGSGPAAVTEDPQRLAAEVFAAFQTAIDQLRQAHHAHNPAKWQLALQHSLNDERLLNITARIWFEAHIAHLLTTGWRQGHELLFNIASKLFHWDEDRRRLQQLGRAGALIDQAIDERAIFERLPESELMVQRAVLDLLRKDSTPSEYQLRNDMPYVERLTAFFPAWLPMVASMTAVAQWRASFAALPPPRKSWWPKLNLSFSPRLGWIAAVVVFQLLRMAFNHNGESAGNSPSRAPEWMHATPAEPVLPTLRPLELEKIQARIPRLPLQMGPGEHQTDFRVVLDERGNIYQLIAYRTSGSVSYDNAANKAIRASAPFPPETPREFQVSFTVPTANSQ